MHNRITELFAAKRNDLLSVFYTAGFPGLHDTVPVALELERSGADLIEIGIPFSDPVADGPTIQQSNKAALDNGMNVRLLLQQVREIRVKSEIPILLMGYLNPVLQYGVEKFVSDAAAAGVDGLILPDLPLHEFEADYRKLFDAANLCHVFLIAPTTAEGRIKKIDEASTGFVYAVSASSTTGARGNFSEEQVSYFRRLQAMKLKNPLLIGFGISDHGTFARASSFGSGAIVGSAFISLLAASKNRSNDIATFISDLKGKPS